MTSTRPPTARPPIDWREQAACRGHDTSLWFPAKGGAHDAAAARAICDGCPVRDQCLAEAVADHEIVGMWGGTTTRERKSLRGRPQLRHGTVSMYGRGCRCDPCREAKADYLRARRSAGHVCPYCGQWFNPEDGHRKAGHMSVCPEASRDASVRDDESMAS